MMICRKTYRKFLLGLLAVSLLGLGVYDYFPGTGADSRFLRAD